MLETIRAYALEQLGQDLDAELVRRRHAEHFPALASAAADQWYTPAVGAWIAWLHRESDNMRAALQWSRGSGNGMLGLQAAAWLAAGQHDDAQASQLIEQSMLLRRALRETGGATNPLINAARQARTEDRYDQAAEALERALADARAALGATGFASAQAAAEDVPIDQLLSGLALL